MLSSKNRLYGLAIGGAVADCMGSLAHYEPDHIVSSPYDAVKLNIKPGYWTEPTSVWISELYGSHVSCTEVSYTDIEPVLAHLIKSSVYCIKYHNNFSKQLQHSVSLKLSLIDRDIIRLWTAIMDGILHLTSKRSLFKIDNYIGMNLVPEVLLVLAKDSSIDTDSTSTALIVIKDVLTTFRNTDNFVSGLKVIVNEGTVSPSWASSLYGQLAGAYYGITDIPENWMDIIQKSELICDLLEPLCESITDIGLQGTTTDVTIGT